MTSPFYSGYRFPSDIIQRAIWLYLRFTLSYPDGTGNLMSGKPSCCREAAMSVQISLPRQQRSYRAK